MVYCENRWVDRVESLLQAPGALTTINQQDDRCKLTALHWTSIFYDGTGPVRAKITKLLLLAGADPHIRHGQGSTPLELLQCNFRRRLYQTCNSLLEEAMLDGGRTFLLHKARHLSDAAYVIKDTVVAKALAAASPALRPRMPALSLSLSMLPTLPRNEKAPICGNNETEEEEKEKEKVRAVLRYVLRVEEAEEGEGAGTGGGMPSEVFYELLKMIKPSSYPVAEGAGSDGKV